VESGVEIRENRHVVHFTDAFEANLTEVEKVSSDTEKPGGEKVAGKRAGKRFLDFWNFFPAEPRGA
jgi:ribosomal protein S17E